MKGETHGHSITKRYRREAHPDQLDFRRVNAVSRECRRTGLQGAGFPGSHSSLLPWENRRQKAVYPGVKLLAPFTKDPEVPKGCFILSIVRLKSYDLQ